MQTERRIAKCAVLAALVLLGGACTKIDAVRSDGKQTQEAVMAAASAAEVPARAGDRSGDIETMVLERHRSAERSEMKE